MTTPAHHTDAVRVPLPDDADVRRVVGSGYDPDTALNVVKMLAGTEDLYLPGVGMVAAVFATSGIDARSREVIILRVATVLDVPYELQANVPMARNAGLTDAEIAATTSEGPVEGIDPAHVLLCRAADELSSTSATLTDATLQDLLDAHGEVLTRKYVMVIAWFNMLSRFLKGCRVPLETTDKVGGRTQPL